MSNSISNAVNNVRIGSKSITTLEHRKNIALLYDTYRGIVGDGMYKMHCDTTYPHLPTIMVGRCTIRHNGTLIDKQKDCTIKLHPIFVDNGAIVDYDDASDDSMAYLVRVIVQKGYTLYGNTIIRTSPTNIEFIALVSNDDSGEEFHLPIDLLIA